jgi:hypothetical protein
MPFRNSIKPFLEQPRLVAVLSLLLAVMGIVLIGGTIPESGVRRYLPGQQWLLAVLCWALAVLFGHLAWRGWKSRR